MANSNSYYRSLSRSIWFLAALSLAIASGACGGGPADSTNAAKYPTGISDDIDQQLKYDARVQDSRQDGDKLVITVNEAWVSQPQGMQERALGHWFSVWKAAHGASSRIVVEYGGEEISSYTADKGFQPVMKKKEGE